MLLGPTAPRERGKGKVTPRHLLIEQGIDSTELLGWIEIKSTLTPLRHSGRDSRRQGLGQTQVKRPRAVRVEEASINKGGNGLLCMRNKIKRRQSPEKNGRELKTSYAGPSLRENFTDAWENKTKIAPHHRKAGTKTGRLSRE